MSAAIAGERIRAAIDAAETGTSGRIGVHVVHGRTADALETAREQLHDAGLHEHPDRNAVVFLVAPKSRRFAVYGDAGIHARVGEEFWTQLVAEMAPYFERRQATQGLLYGIARVGEELRRHFPSGVPA